ncbi:hypothetical protein CF327_g1070 [Tilletia walkeri]|nr:hypothetical protein CF327_g1070 [Tilletia walkeri]
MAHTQSSASIDLSTNSPRRITKRLSAVFDPALGSIAVLPTPIMTDPSSLPLLSRPSHSDINQLLIQQQQQQPSQQQSTPTQQHSHYPASTNHHLYRNSPSFNHGSPSPSAAAAPNTSPTTAFRPSLPLRPQSSSSSMTSSHTLGPAQAPSFNQPHLTSPGSSSFSTTNASFRSASSDSTYQSTSDSTALHPSISNLNTITPQSPASMISHAAAAPPPIPTRMANSAVGGIAGPIPARSTSSKRPLNGSISGPLSALHPGASSSSSSSSSSVSPSPTFPHSAPPTHPQTILQSTGTPRVPVRSGSASIDATAMTSRSSSSSSSQLPTAGHHIVPLPERKNIARPSTTSGIATSRSGTFSRNTAAGGGGDPSASAMAAAAIAAAAAEHLSSTRQMATPTSILQQRQTSLSSEGQASGADFGRQSTTARESNTADGAAEATTLGRTTQNTIDSAGNARTGTPVSVAFDTPPTTAGAASSSTTTAANNHPATATGTTTSSTTRANGKATSTTGSTTRPPRTRMTAPSRYVSPQLPSAPNMSHAPPPAMYWSRAPMHGNIPRRSFKAHTACLADEVLWIFGGCDASSCFRDLFCFDTETMCWSRPRVEGEYPPSRRAHSATMVDRRLFVFAGGDGPAYYNDVWVFDTVALRWSKPEVYGSPPSPRRAHTSSYWEQQLIVFGGGNGIGALNDVFSLDLRDLDRLEWRKWDCFGKKPIGRGYHTSNLVDGKLIVIGGSDGHTSFGDIHILKLDTKFWYHVTTEEQHLRMGHTATQVGSYLFVMGGHDGNAYTSDILTLNLVNLQWEPRRVCGRKPPGRGYHEAWLRDSRLFMHGGYDGRQIYDDLHYVDLAACAYLPQITSFGIELEEEGEEEGEEE